MKVRLVWGNIETVVHLDARPLKGDIIEFEAETGGHLCKVDTVRFIVPVKNLTQLKCNYDTSIVAYLSLAR